MFLGLYAAIAVQDYVDKHKEHKQYKQLLGGFSEELASNQLQRTTVEGQLGKLDKDDLGEASERFEYFEKKANYYQDFLYCYLDIKKSKNAQFKKQVSAKRIKKCKTLMKGFKDEDPKHLSLSPVYRRDVWRFYLAGGVHLFQEFETNSKIERCNLDGLSVNGLAICIGSTYGELTDIETQVKYIQDLVNDTYFRKQGAMETRFKKFIQELGPYRKSSDNNAIAAISRLIKELDAYITHVQYSVQETSALMRFKVGVLKQDMLKLDARFKVVQKAIKDEIDL
jgi:hypothetical protein